MDYSLLGFSVHGDSPGKNTENILSPGDLPNPGVESGSPALQEDFLPVELSGRPIPTLKKWSEIVQLCPILCDPMGYSLPGSSLHGILQARILECVAISFSRLSFWLRDWTQVSCTAGRRFNLSHQGSPCPPYSILTNHLMPPCQQEFSLAIKIGC